MSERSKIDTEIQHLKELIKHQADNSIDQISLAAQKVLFDIFEAAVSKAIHTSEDRRIISSLLPTALEGFGHRLFTLQNNFSSCSIDTTGIERSALQFVLDEYSKFPDTPEEQSDLEEKLNEFTEREDLEGLDDCLRNSVFDYYTDGPRSENFRKKVENLPSHHWCLKV